MAALIANKLENIYCKLADVTEQKVFQKLYGLNCYIDNSTNSSDINLLKDILEYYSHYSDQEIKTLMLTNNCLKKIING